MIGDVRAVKKAEYLVLFVNINKGYPASVPLLAVSCDSLRFAFLRFLTQKLAEKSMEIIDFPMVFELVDTTTELLNQATDPHYQLPSIFSFFSRSDSY